MKVEKSEKFLCWDNRIKQAISLHLRFHVSRTEIAIPWLALRKVNLRQGLFFISDFLLSLLY